MPCNTGHPVSTSDTTERLQYRDVQLFWPDEFTRRLTWSVAVSKSDVSTGESMAEFVLYHVERRTIARESSQLERFEQAQTVTKACNIDLRTCLLLQPHMPVMPNPLLLVLHRDNK